MSIFRPCSDVSFHLVSAFSALFSTTSNNLCNDLAEATKALEKKKALMSIFRLICFDKYFSSHLL